MKTGSKISIIATLSTLALVGTAFAAWEFNKDAEASANSNVAITADTSEGTLVVNPATFYLTLDQGGLAFTSSSHADDDGDIDDAITSVTLTYTGSDEANDVSDVTIENPEYELDDALAVYLSATGGSLGTPSASGNVKTVSYTLPTLSWKEGKKPTTQAQYDSMKTALASAKISFSFSATVA